MMENNVEDNKNTLGKPPIANQWHHHRQHRQRQPLKGCNNNNNNNNNTKIYNAHM